MQLRPLGQGDPLEEGMATHSSVLAWRIPWTEEPGGLQSMGAKSQTPTTKRLSAAHTHINHIFFIHSSLDGHRLFPHRGYC